MSKWPEPRPIEEDAERIEGWELVSWTRFRKCWTDYVGDVCHPTHFLPLPPKPEVSK